MFLSNDSVEKQSSLLDEVSIAQPQVDNEVRTTCAQEFSLMEEEHARIRAAALATAAPNAKKPAGYEE